jgi:hypothetical protein
LIVFTTGTECAGTNEDKNPEKDEAIGNEEKVEEVSYAKEFITGKKTDNAAKHQDPAEYPGSPSEIINNVT